MSRHAMRRRRAAGPPQLRVIRGDAPPESPAPPDQQAEPAREVYVIRNIGLSGSTRLVLLDGDPSRPFADREGVATFEMRHGTAPPDDLEALFSGVRELLEAHARKQWERELRVREWMRRSHLELVS